MIDGTNDWYWPLAEELGLYHGARADLEGRARPDRRAPPGLRLIIDHMGIMARCVDDAIGYWVQETADLREHPNIYVKVSAIPGYSTQPFPNVNIAKYVREIVDKMGPERSFWGTDITRLMGHGLTYTTRSSTSPGTWASPRSSSSGSWAAGSARSSAGRCRTNAT